MMEDQVREAIIVELERQANANPDRLTVRIDDRSAFVEGDVDLDGLAMAVVASVAGAP